MQLDKLIIETRIRSGWSSIDLGFSLARHFWFRAFLVYLLVAVPVYCLTLLLGNVSLLLPFLILWWFKPLFERPILYMVSRELFSEPVSIKRTFRDARLWLKPSFFWIITWRRLSVSRGMTAPIMLLEQPKGADYSKRASILGMRYSTHSMWLTLVLYHIESFLYIALIILIALFFPEFGKSIFQGLYSSEATRLFYDEILFVLAMAAIAPFYVISGFMLYISRRIQLEGWDIEITFRNWVEGYRKPISHLHLDNGDLSDNEKLGVNQ